MENAITSMLIEMTQKQYLTSIARKKKIEYGPYAKGKKKLNALVKKKFKDLLKTRKRGR